MVREYTEPNQRLEWDYETFMAAYVDTTQCVSMLLHERKMICVHPRDHLHRLRTYTEDGESTRSARTETNFLQKNLSLTGSKTVPFWGGVKL